MKTFFAPALLAAAQAVQQDYYYNRDLYEAPRFYDPEPVVVDIVEPYYVDPIDYYAKPVFEFNFDRIFDAGEEVYFGTDSESDIDNDSDSHSDHDGIDSYSGSSLGLSGLGYTFYSGSDSGTESSSHHSRSTIHSYDYFYNHGAKYVDNVTADYTKNKDRLYLEEHLARGPGGYAYGGVGYEGRYYDDYYLEEEPYYRDIIYSDSCSSCSESFESVSTYFDPEFFYVDYPTEDKYSNSDSDSTVYRKGPTCARAYMTDARQTGVYGHVDFRQESIYEADYKKGVQIIAELEGVWPRGYHAIGIHEYGDLSHHCENTGGRWNPRGSKVHGSPDSKAKFAGDLGNILAKRDGSAYYYRWESALSLTKEYESIIGRPVVLKIGEDDFSQYDHSGAPMACGIIEEIACASDDESAHSDDDNYSESDDHYSSASSQGDSF